MIKRIYKRIKRESRVIRQWMDDVDNMQVKGIRDRETKKNG